MEYSVLSFFEHNMMLFYVIPLLYVLKLIGFSPKGRPKMRQFFFTFCTFEIYKLIFLSVVTKIFIMSDLTINIRSSVLKRGVFLSV